MFTALQQVFIKGTATGAKGWTTYRVPKGLWGVIPRSAELSVKVVQGDRGLGGLFRTSQGIAR